MTTSLSVSHHSGQTATFVFLDSGLAAPSRFGEAARLGLT
jgi:hypothetical protein